MVHLYCGMLHKDFTVKFDEYRIVRIVKYAVKQCGKFSRTRERVSH